MIELGPVSGASVDIRTLDGQLITSARTASDGTFSYSIPADKRELMSKNDFVLVESRNGIDTDPTDTLESLTLLIPKLYNEWSEDLLPHPSYQTVRNFV